MCVCMFGVFYDLGMLFLIFFFFFVLSLYLWALIDMGKCRCMDVHFVFFFFL